MAVVIALVGVFVVRLADIQLVQAAEKCPVGAIHPGTPLNPNEKDLEKWLKRAQAF